MKVDIFDLDGKASGKIELPAVFDEKIREDLIRRAVIATLSNLRQPYGTDPMAGKRTSAHYHGSRHHRYSMMNKEMARLPRMHGKLSPHLMWRVRFVPQAKKGREAHPPVVEKIWDQKINKKEKRKAIDSAIAATANKEIVLRRGHKIKNVKELPIVVQDEMQKITKTKDLIKFLISIGLGRELERLSERGIRAGKGKLRGRKYKKKTGFLFVIAEDNGISKAVKNIPGSDVARVSNLSANYLAPGTHAGRLTIWTKAAIEKLRG